MKCLHHNDIMSANVNTAASLSHRGPLERNCKPANAHPPLIGKHGDSQVWMGRYHVRYHGHPTRILLNVQKAP